MSVRSRVGALLVVLGSAGAITSLTQPVAWAAVSATSVFVSSEVTGCSSAIRRDQVDLQDDAWRAQAAASGLSVFRRLTLGPDVAAGATSTTVTSQPASFSFSGTGSSGSVDVSLRDLPVSGGTVGTPSATLPTVSVSASRQLQSCTSYPAGLYGTSTAATPFWNETGGTATTLNGVLFEFATPLRAFGAWFGDVESSPQSPGRVAFFDAA